MIATMTKTQEIESLRRFLDSMPDGYVRDILCPLLPAIATAVQNDLGWIHYNPHEQHRERRELEAQVIAAREQLREIETAAREAEKRTERAARELEEIRAAARSLARV